MKRAKAIRTALIVLINIGGGLLLWLASGAYEYAHPNWFWLGLTLPAFSFWYLINGNKKRASIQTSDLSAFRKTPFAEYYRCILFGLRMFAFALLIIVIARPQSSDSYEDLTREGINIILAMDVSSSMLSMDFEPNRLESAKEVAAQFVAERSDDRIGVVVYEGESITQVPLTTDHRVVLNGLESLQTGLLEGGTAIGMGLATAVNRLKESEGKSKVVILLTDGVNTSGQVNPSDAAQMAELYGIRVYTIGVGTIGKARSPIGMRNGRYVYDWVEVEIDEETLRDIADVTGGKYFRATSQSKLRSIYEEIDQLEKTRFNVLQYKRKTEEFYSFMVTALMLLAAEFLLRNTIFRSLT